MSSSPSNSLFNDQFQRQAEFWNKLQEQTGVQPGETVIVTNYPTKVVTADRVDTSSNKKKTSNTYAPLYSAYGGGYGGSYGASASGSVGPGGVYQSVSTSPGKFFFLKCLKTTFIKHQNISRSYFEQPFR